MSKYLKIEGHGDCPLRSEDTDFDTSIVCGSELSAYCDESGEIPDNCPLPDDTSEADKERIEALEAGLLKCAKHLEEAHPDKYRGSKVWCIANNLLGGIEK